MKLSLIVAMDQNGVIGNQGGIPWRLPRDMGNFRYVTWGKPVIMGMKTWTSLKSPLIGRTNIVLTRKHLTPFFSNAHLAWFVPNELDAIEVANEQSNIIGKTTQSKTATEAMIIGGSQIYSQFLPMVDTIHLTAVEGKFHGDTYFQVPLYQLLNSEKWTIHHKEFWKSDSNNPHNATYFILKSA